MLVRLTFFWVILKSYFEIASFGSCIAHFRCVLTKMCAFECCPSGNISGLLIPSSSPHRFSKENLHICNIFERIFIFIYGKISQVCFYEVPRYCDN